MSFFQNTLASLALTVLIVTAPFLAKAQKIFEGNIYYKLGMNGEDAPDFSFPLKTEEPKYKAMSPNPWTK